MGKCWILCQMFLLWRISLACQFYPLGEYLKFKKVPENLAVGSEIFRIEVHPRVIVQLQPVDYSSKHESSTDQEYFDIVDIDDKHISVVLKESLEDLVDRETPKNVLKFSIGCQGIRDTDQSVLSLTVYVEDINDHAPEFLDMPYVVKVNELTPVGISLYNKIRAVDLDKPNTGNSEIHYSITGGNEAGKFIFHDLKDSTIILKKPLDYDSGDREFILEITATDRGHPEPLSATAQVKIEVQDNDDLDPAFTYLVYKARVKEQPGEPGTPIQQEIVTQPLPLRAYDQDEGVNSHLKYEIVGGDNTDIFSIDPQTGQLYLTKSLDRESLLSTKMTIRVRATQEDNPHSHGDAIVEVEVDDINDHTPKFTSDVYNISIMENLPKGFSVLQVTAYDEDEGENARFSYRFVERQEAFKIDKETGWITVNNQAMLDREQDKVIRMKIRAISRVPVVNPKVLNSECLVEVHLLDANDNNPEFIPKNVYYFNVSVLSRVGDTLGKVTAVDRDEGSNALVTYYLRNQTTLSNPVPFEVDSSSGDIRVAGHLRPRTYMIFVEASDSPLASHERRSSLAVVNIEVITHNERAPEFIGAPFQFWVGNNVKIGTSVGNVRVEDADGDDVTFELFHSYKTGIPFAIEESTGVVLVVDDIRRYDQSLYDLEVSASDSVHEVVTNLTVSIVMSEDDIMFYQSPQIFSVPENKPNALVGTLSLGVPKFIIKRDNKKFTILHDVAKQMFHVHGNGSIVTLQALDREEQDKYAFPVLVDNPDFKRREGIVEVVIMVEDVNDEPPVFDNPQYEGHVKEHSPPGTPVTIIPKLRATDRDTGELGRVRYFLEGRDKMKFRMESRSGQLYIATGAFDRELVPSYELKVIAKDLEGMNNSVPLVVYIDDINDNPPVFDLSNQTASVVTNDVEAKYEVTVPQTSPVGTRVLRVVARDRDIGVNAVITYRMVSEKYTPRVPGTLHDFTARKTYMDKMKKFTIDSETGDIYTRARLESNCNYVLNVSASDGGGLISHLGVEVHVMDVNTHPPHFSKPFYGWKLPESQYNWTEIGSVEAIDLDYGPAAPVSYNLSRQYDPILFPFRIDPNNGSLSVEGKLDYEQIELISFQVAATDFGSPPFTSYVDVEINLLDENDNKPLLQNYYVVLDTFRNKFLHLKSWTRTSPQTSILQPWETARYIPVFYFSVEENVKPGSQVGEIIAKDADSIATGNGLVLYRLKTYLNLFEMDSQSGKIYSKRKLNYEEKQSYNISVEAYDLGQPSRATTALIILSVEDMEESVMERIFPTEMYEVVVMENSPTPKMILDLNVTDDPEETRTRYLMVGSSDKTFFKVDEKTGQVFLINPADREDKTDFLLKVRAVRNNAQVQDSASGSDAEQLALNEAMIHVKILDINDNPPIFLENESPLVLVMPTDASYGYQLAKIKATDADESINADIRYSILEKSEDGSQHFDIDPVTGVIRVLFNPFKEGRSVYGFDVKATDRAGSSDGKSAITNVIVYVVDQAHSVVMTIGNSPKDTERHIDDLKTNLSELLDLDVRINKLEGSVDNSLAETTDLYLFAVDSHTRLVVERERFLSMLEQYLYPDAEIGPYQILDFKPAAVTNASSGLKLAELIIITLASVIFVGALIALACICASYRRKRRKKMKSPYNAKGARHPDLFGLPNKESQNNSYRDDSSPTYSRSASTRSEHWPEDSSSSRTPSPKHRGDRRIQPKPVYWKEGQYARNKVSRHHFQDDPLQFSSYDRGHHPAWVSNSGVASKVPQYPKSTLEKSRRFPYQYDDVSPHPDAEPHHSSSTSKPQTFHIPHARLYPLEQVSL